MANEPKITALLSAVASFIAIVIYLTGKTSIPDFFAGSKINTPLKVRRSDTIRVTQITVPDTIGIRSIVNDEFSINGQIRDLQYKMDSIVSSRKISYDPEQSVNCNINGNQYGNAFYILFFNKKGSNYEFNGDVGEAISGTAVLSGTILTLKGENCSGKLNLLNDCKRLEGRMKIVISGVLETYKNINYNLQTKISQ